MNIYSEVGFDGKRKEFVYGSGYYVKIYKQYRKTRSEWIKIFVKLLEKSKYSTEEAVEIVSASLEKRYWASEQFYIKPSSLVQRINELGLNNLDML